MRMYTQTLITYKGSLRKLSLELCACAREYMRARSRANEQGSEREMRGMNGGK